MKVRENGILRDATPEEENQIRKGLEEYANRQPESPTDTERIADLERMFYNKI